MPPAKHRHQTVAADRFLEGVLREVRVTLADVNAWMVEQGWAMAYRKYSTDYVSHEASAKAGRRGERLEAPPNGGGESG